MSDLLGYLDAFGVAVRIKGQPYRAIFDDDFQSAEFGNVRISSNAPDLLMTKADVRRASLSRDDTLQVYDDELEAWVTYIAKSFEPRTDGFTSIKCIENS
jgi:hypothetical protein